MHRQLIIYDDKVVQFVDIETGDTEWVGLSHERSKNEERKITVKIDIFSDGTDSFGKWAWDKILESRGLKRQGDKW